MSSNEPTQSNELNRHTSNSLCPICRPKVEKFTREFGRPGASRVMQDPICYTPIAVDLSKPDAQETKDL